MIESVKIRNDWHGTSTYLIIRDGHVTNEQARHARKTLCGLDESIIPCRCSDDPFGRDDFLNDYLMTIRKETGGYRVKVQTIEKSLQLEVKKAII